jgi:hypothetical protein
MACLDNMIALVAANAFSFSHRAEMHRVKITAGIAIELFGSRELELNS